MYFYPYAAPLPSAVDVTSATVGVALMVAGLFAVVVLAVLAQRGAHRRVGSAPMISVLPGHTQLPRAAA